MRATDKTACRPEGIVYTQRRAGPLTTQNYIVQNKRQTMEALLLVKSYCIIRFAAACVYNEAQRTG